MDIKITSHRNEVQDAFDGQIEKALTMIGLVAERYAVEVCPKDTGRLANSITHKISGNEAIIGTNVEYAPYVELGTSRQKKPQPYLRPAVADHIDEYRAIVKRNLES